MTSSTTAILTATTEHDRREAAAKAAEAKAIEARQKLADRTAADTAAVSQQRRAAEIEQKRLTDMGSELDTRLEDVDRREGLLRKAGVVFRGDK